MIMTGHIGMPQIEPEVVTSTNGTFPLPATLSDDVITGVLREKLGYDGIVITDALNMQAIADNFTESEAVLKTFDAGVDIALMPTILRSEQDVTKLDRIFKDVIAAVKDGRLSEERIDQSVERILTLKAERGIWNGTTDTTSLAEKIAQSNQIVGSPEHKAKERAMTEGAVTLVKNDQRTLPFKPKKNASVLVIAPAADQTDSMKKTIASLPKNRNWHVTTANYSTTTLPLDQNPTLRAQLDAADYIIVGSNVNTSAKLLPTAPEQAIRLRSSAMRNKRIHHPSCSVSVTHTMSPFNRTHLRHVLVYGFKGDPNGPDSEAGNLKSAGPNLLSRHSRNLRNV
ncbi:hypothetical protein OVA29_15280 [Exiguobacterium sp. SL14]|nr:hypothetical protein [Exiguobacterium sp. SL14]